MPVLLSTATLALLLAGAPGAFARRCASPEGVVIDGAAFAGELEGEGEQQLLGGGSRYK